MPFVFAPAETPSVTIAGKTERFPVRRIFCVGKNYADHVKEMGGDPAKSAPTFFTKPADAVFEGGEMAYPLATENLHYEGELVVALKSGGTHIPAADAMQHVYGYAAGCDLTRRDLQAKAKEKGGPWDTAKALDQGAVIGAITPVEEAGDLLEEASISLSVNGKEKQHSLFTKMIWSVPQVIETLSAHFDLKAGDLIYTGTPEGVGPLQVGDQCTVTITGLVPVIFSITNRP
jgi:fumarylpyruvate hydrolase